MTSQVLPQTHRNAAALEQPGQLPEAGADAGPPADSGRKQGLKVGKETLKRKGAGEQLIYFLLSSKRNLASVLLS